MQQSVLLPHGVLLEPCMQPLPGVLGLLLSIARAIVGDEIVRCIFFFQAEDGIRDLTVTGVQTCALPIFGVCLFPAHGRSADELLQRVQVALEDADEARARVAMYRPGQDEQHRRRLTLITDLTSAIDQDHLTLVYQPKVAMATRSVKSLEALVRWTHPQLGPVSPAEFVPLAESTGGSRRLTNWVLAAAGPQMGEGRRLGLEVDLAVNLSAPDILDPDLCDTILQLLRPHRVDSTSLLRSEERRGGKEG